MRKPLQPDGDADADASGPRLPQDMQNYLAMLAGERQLSPHTVKSYRRELAVLADLARERAQQWSQIDDSLLRRWIARMHARGLAPRSIARRLSAWRTFYSWLGEQGLVDANPVIDLRAPKNPKRLPKALSAELAIQLVSTPPTAQGQEGALQALRDRAIYELLYSSGLRLSELIDLDRQAQGGRGFVDLGTGEAEVTGKGNKRRRVPVGQAALAALSAWLAVRDQLAAPDEVALFVSQRGTRLSPRTLQNRLKAHAAAQNIPANVHPHVLRHSFASHVLQSSGDLRAVQEMLGHHSIASTQVYTSLDFQRLASVYDEAHPRAKRKRKTPPGPA